MTRVLLTGAAGFAGSHCLRHFLANTDWQITCPVSLDHKGRMTRVESAIAGHDPARVSVFPCDLAHPINGKARADLGHPDHIVNYASASHVDRSIQDPVPFVANNLNLMLGLLEYARRVPGLKMFLHVNSDEVFGPAYDDALFGEDAQHRPSNPYAASKSAQSQLGFAWWRTYRVPFTEVYGCNMFGENQQDGEKFVPMVMRKVAAGERVPIHASPGGVPGSRFWQHARNVADAVLFILNRTDSNRYGEWLGGSTVPSRFNITSGDRVSNLDMAKAIADAMGKPLRYDLVDYHASRPGHDLAYGIDGSRLHALGWKPPVSFGEGIRRLVQWERAADDAVVTPEKVT